MFTEQARRLTSGIVEPIALALGRSGLSPNALTVIGTSLHVIVAWLIGSGHLFAGGALLAVAAGFDGLDGTLARLTGRESRFGAFFDSTMDRVSEILAFLGLLAYAQAEGLPGEQLLTLVALAGSLMVSYTRARSEGLQCGTKAGVFGRLERMVVLVVGLLAGWVTGALVVIAVGAWLTVLQRVTDVRRRCDAASAAEVHEPEGATGT